MGEGTFPQVPPNQERTLVDIIWNLTLVCPWDCGVCCVDAVHVTKKAGTISIRSHALSMMDQIPVRPGDGTSFEQAMKWRQQQGLELDLGGKMRVLEHLDHETLIPKIDFSGGDVLTARENFVVLQAATERFGRERITLTATGGGLAGYDTAEIAPYIGELNFTYDSPVQEGGAHRPSGYAAGNIRRAAQFAQAGVKTRGECPLSTHNIDDEQLRTIYLNLHEHGIAKMLLMRLFPVGRGHFQSADIPSPQQYRRAIQVLREMEARYGSPKVSLQCALKFFEKQDWASNPCDLVRESFGLQCDGTLLASPWAVGPHGHPLDEAWILGNLSQTPFVDLLASEKASVYRARMNENHGECKIFAFLHSKRSRPMDRIFDRTDPLYAQATLVG